MVTALYAGKSWQGSIDGKTTSDLNSEGGRLSWPEHTVGSSLFKAAFKVESVHTPTHTHTSTHTPIHPHTHTQFFSQISLSTAVHQPSPLLKMIWKSDERHWDIGSGLVQTRNIGRFLELFTSHWSTLTYTQAANAPTDTPIHPQTHPHITLVHSDTHKQPTLQAAENTTQIRRALRRLCWSSSLEQPSVISSRTNRYYSF